MSDKDTKGGLGTTLWNSLSLNANFYERASNTRKNNRIALTIVILAALSHILGSAVILIINAATLPILVLALVIDGLSIIGGYYFWSFTISKIGQWLKPNHVTYQELLVPIGFAYAPQVLNFLTVIPLLGRAIELVLSAWSLLTVIVAVRQGLDITTTRATIICLIGWPLVQLAIGLVQLFEQRLVTGF